MPNVFVIDVDVHEIAQGVLVVEKVPSQLGMRRSQLIERFTGGRGVDLNL